MTSPRFSHLRRSLPTICIFALCLAANTGCDTSETNTNPRPVCQTSGGGTDCVGPTGGGANPAGGGSSGTGGEGGSSATNDVSGNVGVLNDPSFSQVSPYNGAATIVATAPGGAEVNAQYGAMMTSFTLKDIQPGATWFFVQDQTAGATGIFSTYSVVQVPTNGPITLPVVDRNVISAIAGTLPMPIVIDGSRGVLILKVVRNGQPLAGVTLSTPPAGSTLAYDTGVGLYSNQVQETGPAGVIVAFNVNGPTKAEYLDLTLTDVNQQNYFVQVRLQQGAATFAGFQL